MWTSVSPWRAALGPQLEALLAAHPEYADDIEEFTKSDAAAAAKQARVRLVGLRGAAHLNGRAQGLTLVHFSGQPEPILSLTTGARAKAWCFLIHADASLSGQPEPFLSPTPHSQTAYPPTKSAQVEPKSGRV